MAKAKTNKSTKTSQRRIVAKPHRDRLTIILLSLVTVFNLVLIFHNVSRPMWFDEAWRADFAQINFHIPISDRQSYAPLSLGAYAFTKLSVIFINNNFTQRLLDFICLLALPFVTYWFCQVFLNKRTAQVVCVVGALTGYVLEFSVQDKPYIMDIVLTLLMLIAYQKYIQHQLRFRYFLATSLVFLLTSFASFFVLPCVGLLLLATYWRQRSTAALQQLIAWGASITVIGVSYLYWFIKPQLSSRLHDYFSELYLGGSPLHVLHLTLSNFLTMFGINAGSAPFLSPGLEPSTVLWTSPQLVLRDRPSLLVTPVMGWLYLGLFIYGLYLLYKQRRYFLLVVLAGMYVMEWVAALMQQWAFGNARTNLFSTFIVMIIICYAGIHIVTAGLKQMRYRRATLVLLIVLVVTAFPYHSVGTAMADGGTLTGIEEGIDSGAQAAAVTIAAKSHRADRVVVDFYAGTFSFQYYYQFSDYTKQYDATKATDVVYGYIEKNPLSIKQTVAGHPKVIWVVATQGTYDYDVKHLAKYGYKVQQDISNVDLTTIKMVSAS